ncbi:hypothetical protein ACIPJG_33960 [Streptomyces halstedii]|uniref:hypothetical protein n=1 Tax=Streptomyces halstedii TaxID=1944 RepID=UPI00380FCCA6
MPIYLPAPAHRNGGSDGQGWNRLSLASMGGLADDECALRPRDYSHLVESQDTRRARYGGYGPCVTAGRCAACPIFQSAPRHLNSLDNHVLVRIHRDGYVYLMNRAEAGWASGAMRWTWQDIARLDGWEIGRQYFDEHSDGFWLERAVVTTR